MAAWTQTDQQAGALANQLKDGRYVKNPPALALDLQARHTGHTVNELPFSLTSESYLSYLVQE